MSCHGTLCAWYHRCICPWSCEESAVVAVGENAAWGEDDELFARLEVLVQSLPAMEESSQRLARARAADRVRVLAQELAGCEAALALADRQLEMAQRAVADSRAAGDDEAWRAVLFWGQQRGLRVGPVQNARAALDDALKESGFASEEAAREASLGEDEQRALAEQIECYQRDYAAVLAACQAIEGQSMT